MKKAPPGGEGGEQMEIAALIISVLAVSCNCFYLGFRLGGWCKVKEIEAELNGLGEKSNNADDERSDR